MSFLDVISRHSLALAIIIIILFFAYMFFKKPKAEGMGTTAENTSVEPSPDISGAEKDTTVKRVQRGFNVLAEKVQNSRFMKNMQEFSDNQEQQTENKKDKKEKSNAEYDPLGIDLDHLTKVDF